MMLETYTQKVLPLKNKLFRYACSILDNHDLAKDVVQETMIKVWEKKEELHVYRSIEAWCMTLTRNFALDKLRSKRRFDMSIEYAREVGSSMASPYRETEMKDTMAVIRRILVQLPAKQKEMVQLRDVEGYSYQDIAELTGYRLNDVKISIYRARKRIKEELTKVFNYGLEKSRSAS